MLVTEVWVCYYDSNGQSVFYEDSDGGSLYCSKRGSVCHGVGDGCMYVMILGTEVLYVMVGDRGSWALCFMTGGTKVLNLNVKMLVMEVAGSVR